MMQFVAVILTTFTWGVTIYILANLCGRLVNLPTLHDAHQMLRNWFQDNKEEDLSGEFVKQAM